MAMRKPIYILVAVLAMMVACSGSGAPSADQGGGPVPKLTPIPIDLIPPPPPAAISPVATIGNLNDGAVMAGPSDLSPSATTSQNAVKYSWSLVGPTDADIKSGSDANFPFSVAAAQNDIANYTLTLVVTSSTNDTDTKVVHFQVYPVPAAPVLAQQAACPVDGCPLNGPLVFTVDSKFATDFQWSITTPGGGNPIACPGLLSGNKVCSVAPSVVGHYKVAVTATGPGGSSAPAPIEFDVIKAIPDVKVTGIDLTPPVVHVGPLTLTANFAQFPGDQVQQSWSVTNLDSGKNSSFPNASVTLQDSPTDPVTYIASFEATVNGVKKSVAVAVKILPALTVTIVDQNNLALPAKLAAGSKATLKLKTNVTKDYGNVSYSWVLGSPNGSVNPPVSAQPTVNVVFDKAGNYMFAVQMTTDYSGSAAANATVSVANLAVGVVDGIQNGHSYLKRTLQVSAQNSQNTQTYSWTLMDMATKQNLPNYVNMTNPTLIIHDTDLNFGAYILSLVTGNNSGLPDTMLKVPFNIRKADTQILMPFVPKAVKSIYAVGANDIYVSGGSGLMHLGADGQWIITTVLQSPISGMWARSTNEVYFSANQLDNNGVEVKDSGGIGVYTAKDGMKALVPQFPKALNLRELTGNDDNVLVMGAGLSVYVLRQGQWVPNPLADTVALKMAISPGHDNTIYIITNQNRLYVYDNNLNLVAKIPFLKNVEYKAVLAVSNKEAYVANVVGEIYKYDGAKLTLVATLPINQGSQQYALSMWSEGTRRFMMSQDGGLYTLGANSVVESSQSVLGQLNSLDAVVGSPSNVLALFAGKALKLGSDPVTGKPTWLSLFPLVTDAVMLPSVGEAQISARSSNGAVYVFNDSSTVNGVTSTMQQITADGVRTSVPIPKHIVDLVSQNGGAFLVTADGLMKYDGPGSAVTQQAAKGLDTGKILALDGVANAATGDFYALLDDGIYHTVDSGKNFKQVVTLLAGMKATGFHVMGSQWVMGVSAAGKHAIIIGNLSDTNANVGFPVTGAVVEPIKRIAGSDIDHLFAVSETKILQYDKAVQVWNELASPDGMQHHYRDIQQDNLVIDFMVDTGSNVVMDKATGALSMGTTEVFRAQGSADFVYLGIFNPDVVSIYTMTYGRIGPMQ